MEWKRINFFKGFFTHAEDWQAAESYRSAKHRLHNQAMHGSGIVTGHAGGLNVSLSSDGRILTVEPGLAIDRNGREILLSEPHSRTIELKYGAGTYVYLVARYDEEPIDRRENVANPQYSGHAFIREFAHVELIDSEPSAASMVELARVRIGREPQHNELDLHHRRHIGVAQAHLALHEFAESVTETRIEVAANSRTEVGIADAGRDGEHRFYVASCHPLDEAQITWRIIATLKSGEIDYVVDLQNLSSRNVRVSVRVYRLGFLSRSPRSE